MGFCFHESSIYYMYLKQKVDNVFDLSAGADPISRKGWWVALLILSHFFQISIENEIIWSH